MYWHTQYLHVGFSYANNLASVSNLPPQNYACHWHISDESADHLQISMHVLLIPQFFAYFCLHSDPFIVVVWIRFWYYRLMRRSLWWYIEYIYIYHHRSREPDKAWSIQLPREIRSFSYKSTRLCSTLANEIISFGYILPLPSLAGLSEHVPAITCVRNHMWATFSKRTGRS